MGFWNGVTPNSVANASDGFKEFVVGDNDAYIKEVKEDVSQSGNDMLVVIFANDEGAEIKHFIVDGEYKQQKLKQLYIAFNIPFENQDIKSWTGKRGIVVCKQGKPNSNGNVYNQVSFLRPLPGANVNRNSSSAKPSNTYSGSQAEQLAREADDSGDHFDDDIPF
jgi:hypothetical protein